MDLFTEMTGDRNPQHYDEDPANASRFGGIIVQGGVFGQAGRQHCGHPRYSGVEHPGECSTVSAR